MRIEDKIIYIYGFTAVVGVFLLIGCCIIINDPHNQKVTDVAEVISVDEGSGINGIISRDEGTPYTTVIEYEDEVYTFNDIESYMIAKDLVGKEVKVKVSNVGFNGDFKLELVSATDDCE